MAPSQPGVTFASGTIQSTDGPKPWSLGSPHAPWGRVREEEGASDCATTTTATTTTIGAFLGGTGEFGNGTRHTGGRFPRRACPQEAARPHLMEVGLVHRPYGRRVLGKMDWVTAGWHEAPRATRAGTRQYLHTNVPCKQDSPPCHAMPCHAMQRRNLFPFAELHVRRVRCLFCAVEKQQQIDASRGVNEGQSPSPCPSRATISHHGRQAQRHQTIGSKRCRVRCGDIQHSPCAMPWEAAQTREIEISLPSQPI